MGCKFIALLEAYTDASSGRFLPPHRTKTTVREGILDQPALLMAPNIADTSAAVPMPILPQIIDTLGMGVRPTRAETQHLISENDLFNLTALISFQDDTIAGNAAGSPATSDVAWFIEALRRPGRKLIHRELAGGHLVPVGLHLVDLVVELDPTLGLVPAEPLAELERNAIELLAMLENRRATNIQRRQARAITASTKVLVPG